MEKIQPTIRGENIRILSDVLKDKLEEGMPSEGKITWFKRLKIYDNILTEIKSISEKLKLEIGIPDLNFIQVLRLIKNFKFRLVTDNGAYTNGHMNVSRGVPARRSPPKLFDATDTCVTGVTRGQVLAELKDKIKNLKTHLKPIPEKECQKIKIDCQNTC